MAIMHLNGATVYGSTLVVVPSKTLQVKMPRSMDESGEILNGVRLLFFLFSSVL